jgi:serine/threonine protein kinase/uncharacterized membrane protein
MATNNPLIGKQVGNYRILAEINSGSFGSVYQGKHVIFDDDPMVAIKLLHTALHSPQEHAEFIKEAQVLKKLNHPHILRILDAGFQDGVPYLVTDYAAGGSLRNRLSASNGKPLPLDQATDILTQISQALHYAHERHIIHRDLKPENILFNQAGEALLADFGIAVLLASTRTGLVGFGGTPPYMAPEQFEGLASARSDQYSLGCIAYELVTGHRLFTIPNPGLEAYWFHHAQVEPTPPTRYNPQLPIYIEQAILTALTKNRAGRYNDILAFTVSLLNHSPKSEQGNQPTSPQPLLSFDNQMPQENQPLTSILRSPTSQQGLYASPLPQEPQQTPILTSSGQGQVKVPQPSIQKIVQAKRMRQGIATLIGIAIYTVVNFVLGNLILSAQYSGTSFLLNAIIPSQSSNAYVVRWGYFFIGFFFFIPCFFGVKFGPLAGLIVAVLGAYLGDLIAHFIPSWYWFAGFAVLGFISGLAHIKTRGLYNNTRNILLAIGLSCLAIACWAIILLIGDFTVFTIDFGLFLPTAITLILVQAVSSVPLVILLLTTSWYTARFQSRSLNRN